MKLFSYVIFNDAPQKYQTDLANLIDKIELIDDNGDIVRNIELTYSYDNDNHRYPFNRFDVLVTPSTATNEEIKWEEDVTTTNDISIEWVGLSWGNVKGKRELNIQTLLNPRVEPKTVRIKAKTESGKIIPFNVNIKQLKIVDKKFPAIIGKKNPLEEIYNWLKNNEKRYKVLNAPFVVNEQESIGVNVVGDNIVFDNATRSTLPECQLVLTDSEGETERFIFDVNLEESTEGKFDVTHNGTNIGNGSNINMNGNNSDVLDVLVKPKNEDEVLSVDVTTSHPLLVDCVYNEETGKVAIYRKTGTDLENDTIVTVTISSKKDGETIQTITFTVTVKANIVKTIFTGIKAGIIYTDIYQGKYNYEINGELVTEIEESEYDIIKETSSVEKYIINNEILSNEINLQTFADVTSSVKIDQSSVIESEGKFKINDDLGGDMKEEYLRFSVVMIPSSANVIAKKKDATGGDYIDFNDQGVSNKFENVIFNNIEYDVYISRSADEDIEIVKNN